MARAHPVSPTHTFVPTFWRPLIDSERARRRRRPLVLRRPSHPCCARWPHAEATRCSISMDLITTISTRCRYAGGPVLESDVERAFTLQECCRWPNNNVVDHHVFRIFSTQPSGDPAVALHVAIENCFLKSRVLSTSLKFNGMFLYAWRACYRNEDWQS